MRQKLHLITLGVDNFEKSVKFYEEGLGWKKSDKSMDELALFPLGGITLALHPRQALADDTTLPYQPGNSAQREHLFSLQIDHPEFS
jgi:catechol 2,3-dioxygenase-like lactoylglutathione lyase family enzyme